MTEGLSHAGYHANLTRAIGITPAFGDFAAVMRVGRQQRRFRADHVDDLLRRDDVIHAPAVGGADVHVFDEAKGHAALALYDRKVGELNRGAIVATAKTMRDVDSQAVRFYKAGPAKFLELGLA